MNSDTDWLAKDAALWDCSIANVLKTVEGRSMLRKAWKQEM